jgi:hypothetical protein
MDDPFRPEQLSKLFGGLTDPLAVTSNPDVCAVPIFTYVQEGPGQRSSGHLWGQLGLGESYFVSEEWVTKCIAFIKEHKGLFTTENVSHK